jgi:type VI protein secretion system component Hcp
MAQSNQFLKIIDVSMSPEYFVWGESYNSKHLNEIELVSWDWSVADPSVSTKSSTGKTDLTTKAPTKKQSDEAGDGSPRPSQFSFTKTLDRSTTRLLGAMNTGEVFPFAYLAIEDAYEGAEFPFDLQITLTKVVVISNTLQATAETAGVSFSEKWTINYEDIKFVYLWKTLDKGNVSSVIGTRPNLHSLPKKLVSIPVIAEFKMQPDSDQGPSEKAPLSTSEKASREKEKFEDLAKKNDYVKSSDMEAYINNWAKKKGLIK